MLNRSKGSAMWSPRAQCDKTRFSEEWRHTLENTLNLYIWQDAATELLFDTSATKPRVTGVRTRMGIEFACKAVILTAGTFLDGLMHCGTSHAEGGRAGDAASHGITESLLAIGFETGRMKTGTPARLDARTIDFEILEPQYGDDKPPNFPFPLIHNRLKTNSLVFWSTRRPRCTTSCAQGSTARRCSTGR